MLNVCAEDSILMPSRRKKTVSLLLCAPGRVQKQEICSSFSGGVQVLCFVCTVRYRLRSPCNLFFLLPCGQVDSVLVPQYWPNFGGSTHTVVFRKGVEVSGFLRRVTTMYPFNQSSA